MRRQPVDCPVRRPGRRRVRGMSLVEILVGVAVGVLVVMAAATSLVFIRLSAGTAEDTWRLQQEASTAFRIIGWQLHEAGAQPLVAVADTGRVEFADGYTGFGTALLPVSLAGSDGGGLAPDTLQTSLQNDAASDARDCLGMAPPAGTMNIRNRFSVSGADLSCTGVNSTAGFASGVEDLQVWYGEPSPDPLRLQYRTTPQNWSNVNAVMVCLRIAAERSGQITTASAGCNGETVPADGHVRRSFVRVFRLRNVLS